jgi:hypothetical protein
MRKFPLTLSAEHINFTDVLLGNCDSYIVQIPLATIYISMVFWWRYSHSMGFWLADFTI